jgi:acetylornithine/N-succinyldiaminopimelate aminotransferase
MQLDHVKELENKYLLGTYARYDVLIDRGTGAYLIDKANKRYLDLLAGIGVNSLGQPSRVKHVLRKQIKKPLHVSNPRTTSTRAALPRNSLQSPD